MVVVREAIEGAEERKAEIHQLMKSALARDPIGN